jgi:hypothetical protein
VEPGDTEIDLELITAGRWRGRLTAAGVTVSAEGRGWAAVLAGLLRRWLQCRGYDLQH